MKKIRNTVAAAALAAALAVAPIAAHAASVSCSVAGSVAEAAASAQAAAHDAAYRVQESQLAATAPEEHATVEAAEPADEALAPRTIEVGGSRLGYIDYFKKDTAPERGAGLWMGSDSTTDGDWGYFIGHNPGDFAPVMDLVEGDVVTVCDSEAASRSYTVVDIFDVEVGTYWHEIEQRVGGYGESVVLQACCGDNAHYRVVVAV